MDQEMKNILQRLELSVGKLEEGQTKTNSKLDRMEKRFNQKFDGVDQKFENIDKRFDGVDQKFEKVDKRFDAVDSRLGQLETGQDELKHLLKHNTTLLTDNFTNIRQDLRRNGSETDSDINLLFRKTEKHERDIEKLKKNLKY